MKRRITRIAAFLAAILIFSVSLPFEVFAVDPVSGTVIANAFAQAVAAYGAAHGVSMGFDVANADQIGEGVHDLWDQYKQDVQDNNVPTFSTVSGNFWAYGYKKIGDAVGVDLTAELVEALDGFWNWLLSGPAEMVKVDNQYQWPVDSTTGEVSPIVVQRLGNSPLPVVDLSLSVGPLWSASSLAVSYSNSSQYPGFVKLAAAYDGYYAFAYPGTATDTNDVHIVVGSLTDTHYGSSVIARTYRSSDPSLTTGGRKSTFQPSSVYTVDGVILHYVDFSLGIGSAPLLEFAIPTRITQEDALNAFFGILPAAVLSLLPYGDQPGDITIPDNEDVNYTPLPVGIPLDVSWDPSRYGTGDQPLTDEQKQAIEGDVTDSIEEEGSISLEEETTDDPTTDDPSEEIGELDDYTVPGLADVFPFCIPFDIYDFLSALVATPAPPHFTATFAFPQAIGGSQTIDLDFDTPTFNQLAQLLRLLELLAFIVGLALLTRSMFLRG